MVEVWMKTLREDNFFGPIIRGEEYVLEEPVWRDLNGEPQLTAGGSAKGRPSWKPGDLVILYVGGRERTAGLVEVDAVAYESGTEEWPWATGTTAVAGEGPTLDDLGVPHEMVNRRVRWRLEDGQAQRARAAFDV
jgi:hypothetical protein